MAEYESILCERATRGDEPALEELLVRHLPKLEAYVRLHAGVGLRQRESLGDLVQSICAEVLRNAEGFEYRGPAQFRHWLCKRALHKIVDKGRFHRAAKRDLGREDEKVSYVDCYQDLMTPSRVVQGQEIWQQFEHSFDKLPEEQRTAVCLRRVVGLEYAEVATEMGKSEGAVRNLVYRGLARLAAMLDD